MEENQTQIEQNIDRRLVEDQSRTVGKIAAALAKAQSEIMGAKKGSVNPFFKSGYADLFTVIESCREILAKNEIAFVQGNRFKDGVFLVVTKLIHSSGEWLSSELAQWWGITDNFYFSFTRNVRYSNLSIVLLLELEK